VFSGDLGMPARPVLRDPQPVEAADALLVESTYGNRLHKSLAATETELVEVIERTLRRKRGNVVMPAFSVGRTQEVLFVLADLVRAAACRRCRWWSIRRCRWRPPASPCGTPTCSMSIRATLIDWQRAHPQALRVRFVEDVEESKALNRVEAGLVIISASGMCEAGRIKYHLRNNLPRPECSVVITGFQAAGTLGRRLVEGARRVTLFGQSVPVRAEIHTIGGLSAHADQAGLLGWLGHFRRPPRRPSWCTARRRPHKPLPGGDPTPGLDNVGVPQAGARIEIT
jgi:metallo-beta-lactamase family protein